MEIYDTAMNYINIAEIGTHFIANKNALLSKFITNDTIRDFAAKATESWFNIFDYDVTPSLLPLTAASSFALVGAHRREIADVALGAIAAVACCKNSTELLIPVTAILAGGISGMLSNKCTKAKTA